MSRLRYHASLAASWPLERLLRSSWFPLYRTLFLRRNWLYDVCRFAGTRHLDPLFDVGANVGQTALYLRKFFPRATIHSFEPVAATFRQLQDRIRPWPRLHAHRLALGRARESREIVLQGCSELNSLSHTPAAATGGAGQVERIEVGTLDAFCQENGIERIDVLKTDAQAHDLDVLEGGDRMISSGRVAFIYVEVSFQPGDTTNSAFAAIDRHLVSRGCRLCGFYEQNSAAAQRAALGYCNALYVHLAALRARFPGAVGLAP